MELRDWIAIGIWIAGIALIVRPLDVLQPTPNMRLGVIAGVIVLHVGLIAISIRLLSRQ